MATSCITFYSSFSLSHVEIFRNLCFSGSVHTRAILMARMEGGSARLSSHLLVQTGQNRPQNSTNQCCLKCTLPWAHLLPMGKTQVTDEGCWNNTTPSRTGIKITWIWDLSSSCKKLRANDCCWRFPENRILSKTCDSGNIEWGYRDLIKRWFLTYGAALWNQRMCCAGGRFWPCKFLWH